MNKFVSLALLIAGVVLIDLGIGVTNSLSSEVARLLAGLLTNKSVWMLIGGIVAAVLGLANLSRPPKETRTDRENPLNRSICDDAEHFVR